MIRAFLFITAFLLCGTSCTNAQTLADTLSRLYREAWKYDSLPRPLDPVEAKVDPRLPDMSLDAITHRKNYWISMQEQLASYDQQKLTGQDRINYEVFRYLVDDKVAEFHYRAYLLPFDAEGGFHTAFGFLPGSAPFETREDYEQYLIKLEGFSALVDEYLILLPRAIEEGYVMPCAVLEDYDETARAYVSKTPIESIFYTPFKNIRNTIEGREDLRRRGEAAIANHVFPGYRKLADFLRDTYIPSCRQSIGATDLPDGDANYAQRIRYFTTLDMDAEEIFAIGQREVNRIRSEMEAILDSIGFEGTFGEFLEFLRSDPQFYAKTAEELLAKACYFSKKIDGKLPQYFGKLPRLPYGVAPVPDEIAPRYTAGRYVPGSYQENRAGTYWVNTHNLQSRPLYVLPALTLHEAVPGHHLQISLAAESQLGGTTSLPAFRNDLYISAFGEGWALYTEWLGKEMGIYEDFYQLFGALTYEMWRACRLVVDPGIHAMGWSRDQAVKFLADNTALSIHEIHTEINRYIGWPGQAVSYKIGELKIRELRREAETQLGDGFDLRAFHDKVLENGSIPLFVLERIVRDWIQEELKKRP